MVVVVDDPDRENEGDLVIAAQFATPEAINFMVTHARGQICLPLTEERADELGLPLIADQSERRGSGPRYTAAIDAREGITTGISAADRSHTVQVAISPDSKPSDLLMGGHVQPLRAQARRRARAHRPDGGGGRPRPPRRPQPVRRDLRDHERRRDDGARPRPDPRTASGTG